MDADKKFGESVVCVVHIRMWLSMFKSLCSDLRRISISRPLKLHFLERNSVLCESRSQHCVWRIFLFLKRCILRFVKQRHILMMQTYCAKMVIVGSGFFWFADDFSYFSQFPKTRTISLSVKYFLLQTDRIFLSTDCIWSVIESKCV